MGERPVVDLASGGLPCQPFTSQRAQPAQPLSQGTGRKPKSGSASRETTRSGFPHQHPYYPVVDEFVEYLKCRRPRSFLVEEVPAWDNKTVGDSCVTYMELVAKQCVALGYAVRAITWDHSMFVERFPRERIVRDETCTIVRSCSRFC
jgi:hypothetical protein